VKLRLDYPINPPQQIIPAAKKKTSWGRFIYLSLLVVLVLAAIRWGIKYISLIEAPGIIEGKRIILEAPLAAKIERMDIQIGDKVKEGQQLVFLDTQELRDQIKQQENEVQALKAACEGEQKSLPLLLEERRNELLLRQNTIQHNRQRLLGEMAQLKLKLSQLNNKLAEQKRLLEEGRRLLRINAITRTRFREIRLGQQDLEGEISRTNLRLQNCSQELTHIQHTLDIIKASTSSLPQHIKGKSPLPVLRAKLAAAAEKLELLQASLKERMISSPLPGIVTQTFKQAGEVVMTGEAIAEIVDPGSIWVQAFFDPKDQQRLAEGNIVQLQFDNQLISQGKIHKFYPATKPLPPQFQPVYEPHKRVLIAEIYPLNREEWPLTIGMGVKVQKKKW
jgi:multidrug resistance efflux pump